MELFEYLRCDPDSGKFYWTQRPSNRVKIGDEAGCLNSQGYIYIRFRGILYRGHRLVWEYVNGPIPDDYEVDHINGVGTDNRISNLRLALHKDNAKNTLKPSNNTSGVKGVSWSKYHQKWECYCAVNGVKHRLGRYNTLAEAERVVVDFRSKHHGEFANHG